MPHSPRGTSATVHGRNAVISALYIKGPLVAFVARLEFGACTSWPRIDVWKLMENASIGFFMSYRASAKKAPATVDILLAF